MYFLKGGSRRWAKPSLPKLVTAATGDHQQRQYDDRRADLVEELHQYEGVENQRVVYGSTVCGRSAWDPKQGISVEYKDIHHPKLEATLTKYTLQHLPGK